MAVVCWPGVCRDRVDEGARVKAVDPAALVSLRRALTLVYWRKNDLRRFIEACIGPELPARCDWTLTKREVADNLVTFMERHPSEHNDDLLKLMVQTSRLTDF